MRPSHPPGFGVICLFTPLLDDPDSVLSPSVYSVHTVPFLAHACRVFDEPEP